MSNVNENNAEFNEEAIKQELGAELGSFEDVDGIDLEALNDHLKGEGKSLDESILNPIDDGYVKELPPEITENAKKIDEEFSKIAQETAEASSEETQEAEEPEEDEEGTVPLSMEDILSSLDGVVVEKNVNGEKKLESASELIKTALEGSKMPDEVQEKFKQLEIDREKLDNDLEEVNSQLEAFASKFKSGNFLGGLTEIANLAGVPPYTLKNAAIQSLLPEIERRSLLSDAELKAEMLEAKNDYLEKLTSSKEAEKLQKEQEINSFKLDTYLRSLKEKEGISDSDWDEAYRRLDSTLDKDKEIKASHVVAEAKLIADVRNFEAKTEGIHELFGGKDVPEPIVDALVDIYQENPDFSAKDFKEIVSETLEEMSNEQKESKIAESVGKKVKTTKQTEDNTGLQKQLEALAKKMQKEGGF